MSKKKKTSLLISDFLDVEQSTFCTNICVVQIFDTINNSTPDSKSDTIIIWFPNSSNGRNIVLFKNMLSDIFKPQG